jgi:hypothetical protein
MKQHGQLWGTGLIFASGHLERENTFLAADPWAKMRSTDLGYSSPDRYVGFKFWLSISFPFKRIALKSSD